MAGKIQKGGCAKWGQKCLNKAVFFLVFVEYLSHLLFFEQAKCLPAFSQDKIHVISLRLMFKLLASREQHKFSLLSVLC